MYPGLIECVCEFHAFLLLATAGEQGEYFAKAHEHYLTNVDIEIHSVVLIFVRQARCKDGEPGTPIPIYCETGVQYVGPLYFCRWAF